MTVEEITLLSNEEYEKYKSVVPKIDCCWWLRSLGTDRYCASVVNRNGFVVKSGLHVADDVIAVRPALKLNLDPSDSLFWYKPKKIIGTKIEYGKYQWTIFDTEFGKLFALCDEYIATRYFDSKSNNWDTSELKQWLETEGLKLITA